MYTIINCISDKEETNFGQLQDKECFYSGGTLYMKIAQGDLGSYDIKNVNAISIGNAGLTFFDADEVVYKASKEVKMMRSQEDKHIEEIRKKIEDYLEIVLYQHDMAPWRNTNNQETMNRIMAKCMKDLISHTGLAELLRDDAQIKYFVRQTILYMV